MTSRLAVHPSTQLVWAMATREASLAGKEEVEPLHFLLSLLQVFDGLAEQGAESLELPPDALASLPGLVAEGRRLLGLPDDALTRLRRQIRNAVRPGEPRGEVRLLHRSAASRRLFDRALREALRENAASLTLLHLLRELLASPPADVAPFLSGSPPERIEPAETLPERKGPAETLAERNRPATPVLDRLGRDLTRLAREGRLPPIAGREAEMKALARYLNRTSKRNVLLHGPAGSGKTAIVEGLAQRLVREDAPDFLRRLRLVQVDVGDLVAGTRYRGELEARLQKVLAEWTSDPDLVLFLDEIHLVMGAGAAGDSPMDLANLLKPALARDDVRCIGATTTEEFERHVKADAAFLRRFQLLPVQEPTEAEALEVARRWAARIEGVQGVAFEEEALQAAVSLSARLIRGRALPDKAIDLLENAAVFVKVGSLSGRAKAPGKEVPRIGRAEIVAVLEEQHGIAVAGAEVLDAAAAGAALREELVGLEAAFAALVETLGALGARDARAARPLGVLLLAGPTGTGKTRAAEVLADVLFGGALGRFPMNELKERHELSRLVGAAPGFVGHGESGTLFRHLEAHPQGVLLLDEIEKAHPEVQDYFLQIFDKGEARDSRGRTADFRRQLFVLTCNAAPEGVVAGFRPGPAAEVELGGLFRAEFLGRLDRVIAFRALEAVDFRALLDRRLAALAKERGGRLEVVERARDPLARACARGGGGARGFLQAFDRLVRLPLAGRAGAVRLDWIQDALVLGNDE